jgi:transposase
MKRSYPTDLTDAEWSCLEAHVPAPKKGRGRPRIHTTREILDAVFYVLKSGCPWRLLQSARTGLSRLKHLWLDAGYEGRGRRWAEEVMGSGVEVVRKPPRPVPEEVAKIRAEEWAKEGKEIDWHRLMPPRGYVALPRR